MDGFAMNEPEGGRVVSLALDKYVYVTLNERFDNSIRVSYASMENVESVDDIQHALVREAMRLTGLESGIEITTIADIPGRGTGLGSSSSVTVGLLNAMHAMNGKTPTKNQLAEEACQIEIDILGAPIGRQDQYAAAFGGVNSIRFQSQGVTVEPIAMGDGLSDEISSKFSLVYTGITRSASEALEESSENRDERDLRLREIRAHADQAATMVEEGDLESLGRLLNDAWISKRATSSKVSNPVIDDLHQTILSIGAKGAKLLGAGSGGFFLVYGEKGLRDRMSIELGPENRILPLGIDFSGSEIIH
tara:strand:+ start:2146 stop:3063 length:918 start_codon:yes stop_codon:yes gene_type:complete